MIIMIATQSAFMRRLFTVIQYTDKSTFSIRKFSLLSPLKSVSHFSPSPHLSPSYSPGFIHPEVVVRLHRRQTHRPHKLEIHRKLRNLGLEGLIERQSLSVHESSQGIRLQPESIKEFPHQNGSTIKTVLSSLDYKPRFLSQLQQLSSSLASRLKSSTESDHHHLETSMTINLSIDDEDIEDFKHQMGLNKFLTNELEDSEGFLDGLPSTFSDSTTTKVPGPGRQATGRRNRMYASSVLKKRRLKMKKHKLKRRRKLQRKEHK